MNDGCAHYERLEPAGCGHQVGSCIYCGQVKEYIEVENGRTITKIIKRGDPMKARKVQIPVPPEPEVKVPLKYGAISLVKKEDNMARSKRKPSYYDERKDGIVCDLMNYGVAYTREKWDIPSSTMSQLMHTRWKLDPETLKKIEEKSRQTASARMKAAKQGKKGPELKSGEIGRADFLAAARKCAPAPAEEDPMLKIAEGIGKNISQEMPETEAPGDGELKKLRGLADEMGKVPVFSHEDELVSALIKFIERTEKALEGLSLPPFPDFSVISGLIADGKASESLAEEWLECYVEILKLREGKKE